MGKQVDVHPRNVVEDFHQHVEGVVVFSLKREGGKKSRQVNVCVEDRKKKKRKCNQKKVVS